MRQESCLCEQGCGVLFQGQRIVGTCQVRGWWGVRRERVERSMSGPCGPCAGVGRGRNPPLHLENQDRARRCSRHTPEHLGGKLNCTPSGRCYLNFLPEPQVSQSNTGGWAMGVRVPQCPRRLPDYLSSGSLCSTPRGFPPHLGSARRPPACTVPVPRPPRT